MVSAVTVDWEIHKSLPILNYSLPFCVFHCSTDCSNTITYTRGYIASPGYPAPYPHNKDCVWRVIVPNGRRIAVTFNAIDLEEHSACNYDYIEARDGSLSSSTRVSKIVYSIGG